MNQEQPHRVWIIGRDPDCDVYVLHPSVAGHHCMLAEYDHGFLLEDYGSTNGTYVNGQRLSPHEPHGVTRADIITFGRPNGVQMSWPTAQGRPYGPSWDLRNESETHASEPFRSASDLEHEPEFEDSDDANDLVNGFSIRVGDPEDPDDIDTIICASNGTFSGSIRIFVLIETMDEFANRIAGFPTNPRDERVYEFGEPGGTYARIHFCRSGGNGQQVVHITLHDGRRSGVQLSFGVEAAEIDRFVASLRRLRYGPATAILRPS